VLLPREQAFKVAGSTFRTLRYVGGSAEPHQSIEIRTCIGYTIGLSSVFTFSHNLGSRARSRNLSVA